MNKIVSIVMVTYNCKDVVKGTLESIIGQTLAEKEIIVIDGGSTDGTMEIINSYMDKIDVLISEPDHGVYDAMNKGIRKASGEWIIFMNSGDFFYKQSTLEDVFASNRYDDSDIVYGSTKIETNDFEYVLAPASLEVFSSYLPFCHQSTFVRTVVMKKYGYDLKYRICADYNFFYNCYINNYRFKKVNNIISIYDQTGPSLSNQNVALLKNELKLIRGEVSHFSIKEIKNWFREIRKILIIKYATNYYKKRTLESLKSNQLVSELVVKIKN